MTGQLNMFADSAAPAGIDDFLRSITPLIDGVVNRLGRRHFIEDPISGPYYSRMNSILSSSQKRHGRIIEIALREGLRESNRYTIWSESRFAVSDAADRLFNAASDDWRKSNLPYGDAVRWLQIDLIAFDVMTENIGGYEVKRGNGRHDAGKVRSMRRDLACMQVLLASYGEKILGRIPKSASAKMIFYYGHRSIGPPHSLVGAELDAHFDFPIVARIEAANDYYKQRIAELLESNKESNRS
jgi:hypothetical protein